MNLNRLIYFLFFLSSTLYSSFHKEEFYPRKMFNSDISVINIIEEANVLNK